jgi:hypothetical protein
MQPALGLRPEPSPRPLKVEAPNPAIDVQHLAHQIKTRQRRDSIVEGSISSSATPPAVASAKLYPRLSVMVTGHSTIA